MYRVHDQMDLFEEEELIDDTRAKLVDYEDETTSVEETLLDQTWK